MMGYFWFEHFTQMSFADAYVDPHKMTYRPRQEAQAYIPEGIVWRIVASAQRSAAPDGMLGVFQGSI